MGYLLLSIALLSGAVKGYCGKKTSGFVTQYRDSMLINLIRMLLCIAIGLAVLLVGGSLSELNIGMNGLLLSALSGVTTSVFVCTWILSVRKGAYMLVDVFLMLGVLVTIVCSFFVLHEEITLQQILGFVLLLVAVLLMCSYQKGLKGKLTVGAVILLILCGVSNGLTDFSQKLFVQTVENASVASFQVYTYLFSALTLFLFYVFSGLTRKSDDVQEKDVRRPLPKSMLIYILIMAICLYLNSFFKTQAAAYLPSAQLYPLNQGGGLLLSTAMASIFFKEKPNAKSIIGLVIAFVALLLINLKFT